MKVKNRGLGRSLQESGDVSLLVIIYLIYPENKQQIIHTVSNRYYKNFILY